MAFVEVDDLSIRYRLAGPEEAPAVLLIHSLGTSLDLWEAVATRLSRRFRVVSYDLRGHGLTEGGLHGPEPATSIDELAGDAAGLLERLGIPSAAVAGVSIGGMVALALAARRPDRVRRLVLCDTGHRVGSPALWEERIAAVRAEGLAGMADAVLARWVTDGFRAADPAAWRGMKAMLLATPAAGYVACCRALAAADLEAAARTVRCPALVLVGDRDVSTPPAVAEELAALLADARLQVIEGAAHLPMPERPEAVAEALMSFLAEPADAGYEAGLAVRRAVLGTAHVERSLAGATPFDADFQRYITEHVWGTVWTRPGLDRRSRSLLTVGLLAALGHHAELRLHVRATRNTGVAPDEVKEALIHVAAYAGVPAVNTAFRVVREVYEELEREDGR